MTDELYDFEAEQYVIGGCLLDYRAFAVVDAIIKPEDFFLQRHEWIYEAISTLARSGGDTDIPLVTAELRRMSTDKEDIYDQCGREYYLMKCEQIADNSGKHFAEMAMIIQSKATRRRVLKATDEIRALALRKDLSDDLLENESENKLREAYKRRSKLPASPIGDAVQKFSVSYYQSTVEGGQTRLYTDYPELDNPALIGGFKPGDLVVIGADSGMGKTSLIMNFAYNFAKDGKLGLFISKEMEREEMSRRLIAIMADIPLIKLRKYTPEDRAKMANQFIKSITMTDTERASYAQALSNANKLPLLLKHMPNPTPLDIWSEARLVKGIYGRLDYLIVDQLTDMPADEIDKSATRAQELGVMAGRFKEMSATDSTRGLACTTFVLSQIKPSVKQRADKRPVKGDFQDSTAIGNQADIQMFFYRDVEYNPLTENPNIAEVLVRKHRDGATGRANLHFNAPTTKLSPLSYKDELQVYEDAL